MAIIEMHSAQDVATFIQDFNKQPLTSLESALCHLVRIRRISKLSSDPIESSASGTVNTAQRISDFTYNTNASESMIDEEQRLFLSDWLNHEEENCPLCLESLAFTPALSATPTPFVDRILAHNNSSLGVSSGARGPSPSSLGGRDKNLMKGYFITACMHSFHIECVCKMLEPQCPVCRFQHDSTEMSMSKCQYAIRLTRNNDNSKECDDDDDDDDEIEYMHSSICGRINDLWMCLVCGAILCGKLGDFHVKRHYQESLHAYALNLDSKRVWDFAGDGYVHRLIMSAGRDGEEGEEGEESEENESDDKDSGDDSIEEGKGARKGAFDGNDGSSSEYRYAGEKQAYDHVHEDEEGKRPFTSRESSNALSSRDQNKRGKEKEKHRRKHTLSELTEASIAQDRERNKREEHRRVAHLLKSAERSRDRSVQSAPKMVEFTSPSAMMHDGNNNNSVHEMMGRDGGNNRQNNRHDSPGNTTREPNLVEWQNDLSNQDQMNYDGRNTGDVNSTFRSQQHTALSSSDEEMLINAALERDAMMYRAKLLRDMRAKELHHEQQLRRVREYGKRMNFTEMKHEYVDTGIDNGNRIDNGDNTYLSTSDGTPRTWSSVLLHKLTIEKTKEYKRLQRATLKMQGIEEELLKAISLNEILSENEDSMMEKCRLALNENDLLERAWKEEKQELDVYLSSIM